MFSINDAHAVVLPLFLRPQKMETCRPLVQFSGVSGTYVSPLLTVTAKPWTFFVRILLLLAHIFSVHQKIEQLHAQQTNEQGKTHKKNSCIQTVTSNKNFIKQRVNKIIKCTEYCF